LVLGAFVVVFGPVFARAYKVDSNLTMVDWFWL
jgi:hypothetical protein